MAKRKAAARKSGKGARGRKTAASRVTRRTGAKRAAARSTRRPAARKKTARPASRKGARKTAARKASARKAATRKTARKTGARKTAASRPGSPTANRRPEPTRPPRPAALDRERRILREDQEPEPHGVPSSLDYDRAAASFDTGRAEMLERRERQAGVSSTLTAGDVDADWEGAYSTGEEAPGGDNPTPDQDIVEEIGRALGVEYQDNEELHQKVAERDEHRWELDPASSEDYRDRNKG
jgi:hypothetical protein